MEQQILLQFLKTENIIITGGINYNLTDQEYDLLKSQLPSFWSSDNDILLLFTYFSDGTYFCERQKTVYDYKLKTSIKRAYQFREASNEQANDLYQKFLNLAETIRIKQLQEVKDNIKEKILEESKLLLGTLVNYRNDLLKASDFSQFPDVPMDEKDRDLWKKYRQYLRDMPSSDAWLLGDIRYVNYPINPYQYINSYPNRNVEYLSTSDQFDNYGIRTLKLKLTKILAYLALPNISGDGPGPYLNKEDLKDLDKMPYEEFLQKVNKYLGRIDENLKFEVKLVDAGCTS